MAQATAAAQHTQNPDQPAGDPFEFHRSFVSARSRRDKHLIARIKRFVEWMTADPEFRIALEKHPERAGELCAARGLEVDPHQLEPLWKEGFANIIPQPAGQDWPLLDLWRQWIVDIIKYRDLLFRAAGDFQANPGFAKWRARRTAFGDFSLGKRNKSIVYPAFAYELTQGCSMGCWFCAFAAQRLSGVFRYDAQNARLWRGVLEAGREVLGRAAAQSGFCYNGTEPADNPDYIRFLKDFHRVNGVLSQTTTAASLRDLAWTRELLALYENEYRAVKPRFSVLSLGMLEKIHAAFSPDELLRVELIPQNRGSFLQKSLSGRAALEHRAKWWQEKQARHKERVSGQSQSDDEPEKTSEEPPDFKSTTSCLSGFLVNMVQRTVALVSPCPASPQRPFGYRVHAQGHFPDAAGYKRFLEECVQEYMPETLPPDRPLAFSDLVDYQEEENGFCLRSPAKLVRMDSKEHIYTKVAGLLAQGGHTSKEIMADLVAAGETPLSITAGLQHFYRQGMLD